MKTMEKIRLLFFADTHLGFDFPIRPRIQRRRRGTDFFRNFNTVLQAAIDQRVDFVVHGGDLFYRSKLPPKIVDLVYHDLFEFANHGIPIYLVPGNHERSLLPQSLFLNHRNINIFDFPKSYFLETRGVKINLFGFPCVRTNIRSDFTKLLPAKQPDCDINLLCMHQTVEGAKVEKYTFRTGPDVISMKDFPAHYDAVLSGHIHRKQILHKFIPRKQAVLPIVYPGSIERTSFAEMNEAKGYFIIEFQGDDTQDRFMPKFIFTELNTRPMIEIIIENTITRNHLPDFLLSKIKKLPDDAIVRLKAPQHNSMEIMNSLTVSFLRSIFPKTMNVQISGQFQNYDK